MKYALISEEQIENLKGLTSVLIRLGHPYNAGLCAEILESLKPSGPVAWMVKDVLDGLRYPSSLKNPGGSIKGESQPLYALDEVTK